MSKPTIHELEKILEGGECPIEILPNGEVRHKEESMNDRYKVPQPYRNPGEFKAYLDGVKATVEAMRPELSVDALAWGGGIPVDVTIYKKKKPGPAPVVVTAPTQRRAGRV